MNEQELGKEIVRLLDRGTSENIKQSTLYQLQSMRRAALENCQPAMKIVNAGSGISAHGGHEWHFHGGKLFLFMMLVLALVSTIDWQTVREQQDENALIDTRILTDDLPIDAYLDNGFDEWLDTY